MLLTSLIYQKNNRFYLLKPVVLLYLSLLLTHSAYPETDFDLKNDHVIFSPELKDIISEKARKKSSALTDYAFSYMEMKRTHITSEQSVKRLLNSIRNDPEGVIPLRTLLAGWGTSDRTEKIAEQLLPVAKENPEAIDLNIIVAQSLSTLKRDNEAIELLKHSLSAVGFRTNNDISASLISGLLYNLTQQYGKIKEWSEGEALLDKALEVPELKDSITVRLTAAKFYSLCADQGPDGFFAGWSKRRYRKKLEHNLDMVERLFKKENFISISFFPILTIYKRYSMKKRAEDLIFSQLLKNPSDARAFIMLAKVFEDNGDYANAFRVWNIIVNSSRYPKIKHIWKRVASGLNGHPDLHYQLGYSALKSKNWTEAIKAFDWILIKNPDSPAALYQLGFAFFKLEKYKKAIYKFEKVDDIPESNYFIAHCYRRLGEYKNAFDAMQKAETVAKKTEEEQFLTENFYIEFAIIADKAEKWGKVESILTKIIKKNPDNPMINNFLGYFWVDHNKNLDQAEKMIQKALDADEDNFAYLDSMAWALYKKKDYDNALNYIKKALKYSESPFPDSVISDHAGDIYAALDNKKAALKYWNLALEIYSDDIDEKKIKKKISDLNK